MPLVTGNSPSRPESAQAAPGSSEGRSLRVGGAGTVRRSRLSGGAATTVDAAEAELAARLRLAVTRLHRRLRQQAAGGLTPSQASALAGIEHLGSPTLGALAARESVRPPSMTRVVGALEDLGYVTRVADATDRRSARVTVTAAGRAVLRRNRSLKNAFLAERLHALDPADRAALTELTALLERLVEGDEP